MQPQSAKVTCLQSKLLVLVETHSLFAEESVPRQAASICPSRLLSLFRQGLQFFPSSWRRAKVTGYGLSPCSIARQRQTGSLDSKSLAVELLICIGVTWHRLVWYDFGTLGQGRAVEGGDLCLGVISVCLGAWPLEEHVDKLGLTHV